MCVRSACTLQDVAAATFMAIATTTPEFFTNVISTFIAESDIGLGAIIGSLMFNTLGVAAVASFAATKPVQLDWWPITRDSILYASNIVLMIVFAWDNKITLDETIVMAVLLCCHFVFIFQSKRIMPKIKWFFEDYLNCCRVDSYGNVMGFPCPCTLFASPFSTVKHRRRLPCLPWFLHNFRTHFLLLLNAKRFTIDVRRTEWPSQHSG